MFDMTLMNLTLLLAVVLFAFMVLKRAITPFNIALVLVASALIFAVLMKQVELVHYSHVVYHALTGK